MRLNLSFLRASTCSGGGCALAALLMLNAVSLQAQPKVYPPSGYGSQEPGATTAQPKSPAKLPQPPAPNPPPSVALADATEKAGAEILTRGPVHEAFAQPSQLGRSAGVLVNQRPPQLLNELPPNQRPALDGVTWIPGYWSWDADRNDFIWISGVWRVPPPDSEWAPGYWANVGTGYRWVSGFWADMNVHEIKYYPEPPVSLENGPLDVSPSTDDFWSPGEWKWQDNRYKWKPGYWAQGKAGSVWTPPSYRWTPRGYLRTTGFWDAALDRRGLLFAPAAIGGFAYQNPGVAYIPSVAIDPAALNFYLFTRPAYGSYYFGDYFGTVDAERGIFPWYTVNRVQGYHYDPLFSYDQWYYASRDPKWISNMEAWNKYYRDNMTARPPHTMTAETTLEGQLGNGADRNRADRKLLMIGRTLASAVGDSSFPMRFSPLTAAERSDVMAEIRADREFIAERSQLESAKPARRKTTSANISFEPELTSPAAPETVPWPKRSHAASETNAATWPNPNYRESRALPVSAATRRIATGDTGVQVAPRYPQAPSSGSR